MSLSQEVTAEVTAASERRIIAYQALYTFGAGRLTRPPPARESKVLTWPARADHPHLNGP
jgi:hypothetical protein